MRFARELASRIVALRCEERATSSTLAATYSTHAAIEAALNLARSHGPFSAQLIASAEAAAAAARLIASMETLAAVSELTALLEPAARAQVSSIVHA
jgi:hypothetical protein